MQYKYIWIGIIVVLIVFLGFSWFKVSPVTSPVSSSTTSSVSSSFTTSPATSFTNSNPRVNPLSFIKLDEVKTWGFVGSYKDKGVLEAKTLAEITRLERMLKGGQFTDYELYVSIANQYSLLGDGKKTYEYLEKALKIDSEKTGLAWNNLGQLMEKLGAYENARIAFDRAIQAQPLPNYYMAKIDFLEKHFPEDKDAILKTKQELGTPKVRE